VFLPDHGKHFRNHTGVSSCTRILFVHSLHLFFFFFFKLFSSLSPNDRGSLNSHTTSQESWPKVRPLTAFLTRCNNDACSSPTTIRFLFGWGGWLWFLGGLGVDRSALFPVSPFLRAFLNHEFGPPSATNGNQSGNVYENAA